MHLHTPVQHGKTALILALENEHEAAAVELMEPTKLAGALDLQTEPADDEDDTDDEDHQRCIADKSALHVASEKGLAGAVVKLLSLGADASLRDRVRA